MKLCYYKSHTGNFGDDLNPWLWSRLIPDLVDDDSSTLLVGIGTILNDHLPPEPRKVVFGSGVGYRGLPRVDQTWDILCVRGPMTASALGIDPRLAITDGAALIASVDHPLAETRRGAAYMPHHASERHADWPTICALAGTRYISPAWDVDRILLEISGCSVLLTEALHGAIAADVLRVPWVAVTCYSHILEFKWQDWAASMELEYRPVQLAPVFDSSRRLPLERRAKNSLKRVLRAGGLGAHSWSPPDPPNSSRQVVDNVIATLANMAGATEPLLSSDGVLSNRVARLQESLRELRKRYS